MARPNVWLKKFPITKKVGSVTHHWVTYPCCGHEAWISASNLGKRLKEKGSLTCRKCSVAAQWANYPKLRAKLRSEGRNAAGKRVTNCKDCGVVLDETTMHKNSKLLGEPDFARCKSCKSEAKKRRRNPEVDAKTAKANLEKYWYRHLLNRSKRSSRHETTIDHKWIKDQYAKQQGKCFWTGVDMEITSVANHPLKPSLDRLDGEIGYDEENTVLCCLAVNIGRNENDAASFEQFLKLLAKY